MADPLDCQNILETLGRRNKAKLEAASQQLINLRGYPTYSMIKRLMVAIDSDQKKPRAGPSRGLQPQEHAVTGHRRGRAGPRRGLLPARPVSVMFTGVDHGKFRALRITHVATRFEQLISDEGNGELTPEQLFLTAVDDALDARRAARIDKLIRASRLPDPDRDDRRDRLPRGPGHPPHQDAPLRRT